jgi:hypothetical protein
MRPFLRTAADDAIERSSDVRLEGATKFHPFACGLKELQSAFKKPSRHANFSRLAVVRYLIKVSETAALNDGEELADIVDIGNPRRCEVHRRRSLAPSFYCQSLHLA